MTGTLTPVLLTDDDRIVLLPLENPEVINQKSIYKIQGCDIPMIDDNDFRVLKEKLGLPDVDTKDTEAFIASRIVGLDVQGLPKFSQGAADWISKHSLWGGDEVRQIISGLPFNLTNWIEGSVEDIAKKLGVNIQNTPEKEKAMVVVDAIEKGVDTWFEKSYSVNGEDWLLYTKLS